MTEVHKYDNFREEYMNKVSAKIFYRFAVALFVFYIIIFLCAQSFYSNYSYITISGASMQNTINPNPAEVGNDTLQDGVFIKLTKDVDYSDIVILKSEIVQKNKTIIKRVLAFEGDYITIAKIHKEGTNKKEFRFMRVKSGSSNIEVIEENYIKSYNLWNGLSENTVQTVGGVDYEKAFYSKYVNGYNSKFFYVPQVGTNVEFFQVPEDNIFFMGDNRSNSTDARYLGTYETNRIVGKVVEIVEDGSKYEGNHFWWLNRVGGFIKICWLEVLRFFGANV